MVTFVQTIFPHYPALVGMLFKMETQLNLMILYPDAKKGDISNSQQHQRQSNVGQEKAREKHLFLPYAIPCFANLSLII